MNDIFVRLKHIWEWIHFDFSTHTHTQNEMCERHLFTDPHTIRFKCGKVINVKSTNEEKAIQKAKIIKTTVAEHWKIQRPKIYLKHCKLFFPIFLSFSLTLSLSLLLFIPVSVSVWLIRCCFWLLPQTQPHSINWKIEK